MDRDNLTGVMASLGYSFRLHLEEEVWTRRKLTVVDLDERRRAAFEREGVAGLRAALEPGEWTFPAFDIERLPPSRADVVLFDGQRAEAVLVPGPRPWAQRLARGLAEAVRSRWDCDLPVLDDAEAPADILGRKHVILLGGVHENRLAMEFAWRYQHLFVDATIPGAGGWLATTHAALDASGRNVLHLAAGPATWEDTLAAVLSGLHQDKQALWVAPLHHIQPGAAMRRHFPSWENFTSGLLDEAGRLLEKDMPAVTEPEAVASALAEALDSGGVKVNRYNAAAIDMTVLAARYAQRSNEPRAAALFRALLFRFADYYLKTPGGASIPSDLEFRAGPLVVAFARLEHRAPFTPDERLFLWNFLLACMRSVYDYTTSRWPKKPDQPVPHNHQTFPARSLWMAADVFERFGVADVAAWRTHAQAIFSGELWRRYKQRENANGYEGYVFQHAASFSAAQGRRLGDFTPEVLREVVRRSIVTTDNFFRAVDYGDASYVMTPAGAGRLPALVAAATGNAEATWFARQCFRRRRNYVPPALEVLTHLQTAARAPSPPVGCWEELSLDPLFLCQFGSEIDPATTFDKLAFRTGWRPRDHYLLLEGVGRSSVSHAHLDPAGIVRLNHLGRHWIVSNGYGRRAGVTNVAESWSTRVRGPEDHNMLILQRDGAIVRDLPLSARLIEKGQQGDWLYATLRLDAYGGVQWTRSLWLWAGRFLWVLDRVQVVQPGLEAGHIEWNMLGDVASCDGGYVLDQKGVAMQVLAGGDWPGAVRSADQSADWKRTLESGAYPYARFPLTKLVFSMPGTAAGRQGGLSSFFAAYTGKRPPWRMQTEASGRWILESQAAAVPTLDLEGQGWRLRAQGRRIELSM